MRKSWRSAWGTIQHKLKGAFHCICECKAPRLSEKQIKDLTNEARLLRGKLETTQDGPKLEVLLAIMGEHVASIVAWSKVVDAMSSAENMKCIDIAQEKLDKLWHQVRNIASDAAALRTASCDQW